MVRSFLFSITLWLLCSIFSLSSSAQGVPAIFLHTDKGAYFPGDTVWFKGYVLNDGFLDESLRNLYIDWGNHEGTILEHNVYLLSDGVTPSHFVIPTNYESDILNLNAYTPIIAKNKEMGYFRAIPILQQKARKKAAVKAAYFLSIQPEGGVLLKGVMNKVILSAYDQTGHLAALNGKVLMKSGEELLSFSSKQDGFAEIAMIGTEEEKTIEWSGPDGKISSIKLPAVLKEGAKLSVSSTKDTVSIALLTAISQQDPQTGVSQEYTIEARLNRHQLFRNQFKLTAGARGHVKLPKNDLDAGVLQLLLFDEKGKIIGQRSLMIEDEELVINPKLEVKDFSRYPKGRNTLQIGLPEGEYANLSISITDAQAPVDSTHTIVDALLFSSLSKHRIIEPFSYFKNKTMLSRFVQTNSWHSDFSSFDALKPLKDSLLYLKGRIRMNNKDKLTFDKRLASLKERNSKKGKSVKGVSLGYRALSDGLMKYTTISLDEQGRFEMKKFNFLDSMELRFVQIEEAVNAIRFHVDYEFAAVPKPDRLYLPSAAEGLIENQTFPEKIWEYNPRYFKDKNGVVTLREVRIKTRRNYRIENMDKYYAKGWYSREGLASIDIQNDSNLIDIYDYNDLVRYLQLKYPIIHKIRPIYVFDGIYHTKGIPNSGFSPRGRDSTAVAVEYPDVNQIAFIKIFETHPNNPNGGAIVFYTTGPDGANRSLGQRIDLQTVGGYVGIIPFSNRLYSNKEKMNLFYDDDRQTLYWNPMVLMENRSYTLEFDNNSNPRGYWVTIQGVTKSGKMVYYQKLIEKADQ